MQPEHQSTGERATNPIVRKVVERVARAIVHGYTRDDRREVTERDREIAWRAIEAIAADMGGPWVVERIAAAAMDYSADLQGDRSGMGLRTAYAVRDGCDVLSAIAGAAKETGK